MASIRQTNFLAGELSPTLHGRTDLDLYARGLRRCRNFFISKHGAAVSRPGMKYCGEVKNSAQKVRLIPFIYSDSQSYVLEFGPAYIRFWTAGGRVESGGVPVEVVTPYAEADLSRLKFAQSGDVLVVAHHAHAPRELKRLSHTSWTFFDLIFDNRGFESPSEPGLVEPLPTSGAADTVFQGHELDHPAKEWIYQVTNICETTDGTIFESPPHTVTKSTNGATAGRTYTALASNNLVVYHDRPMKLDWRLVDGGSFGPQYGRIIAYRVYRGRGDLFGLVGETKTGQFTDYGKEPDYSRGPPKGRNPFRIFNSSGMAIRVEEPSCVAYYEERRMFARTDERPAMFWGSTSGDYYNFDDRSPSVADEALEYELASRKREEIRSLVDLGALIAFTDRAVWSIEGEGGGALAPTTIPRARVQAEIGASWLDPVIVDEAALYARTKGFGVRALLYSQQSRGYVGADLSFLAQHLFTGYSIDAWTYAEDPWGAVWAVRSDGKLLSLTYMPGEGNVAWGWHDTDGVVESIAAIPETTEDFVYLVVRRTINGVTKRYIERMVSRVLPLDSAGKPDVKQAIALDCASTYSGAPATVISGLGYLEGKEVYALADGNVLGPFTVASGQITLAEATSLVHVGLKYSPELETLDAPPGEAKLREKLVTTVGFEVDASRGIKVGTSFDSLAEWTERQVADSYGAIGAATSTAKVYVNAPWGMGGRAVLRVDDPLFVTVLGLTREVQFGGT